jgi:glutaredoxin
MMFPRVAFLLLPLIGALAACDHAGTSEEASELSGLEGAPIEPPFEVKGDLDGLLLVWFDEEGPHTAASRDEIPEEHREHVRVDDLSVPPDERLDPEFVYVADLRTALEGGSFAVHQVRRDAYDGMVDEAQGIEARPREPEAVAAADPPPSDPSAEGADADVVIYGADWCNACRATARFFRSRGVPFVEKNVERDSRARAEMQQKAQAAGVRPTGIPVIDFRGTILTGFDQRRLEQLIARGT